ncbi:MAG: helix-turn-helix domain-containing protein [Gammaproteobacteria bacterium]|nr:helix-turn-helix domain-containing protein [Gammaproteobacteria bacterium]MCF6261544.1 helix-turn-helix domain-containing protein [Gammaproteobacteria bacterium]
MAYDGYGRWPKYVSVAQRRAKAEKEMQKLVKKGVKVEPIKTEGRKIARTFWGKAWCDHLEKFSDYENRLPRGRTYVRNGSVCHLEISKGNIEAIVSGSELYSITIEITPLSAKKWQKVREQCAGQIGSMLELLQGHFSDNVMKIVTEPEDGLFPQPREIKLDCDCPDWADMCKHIAAVLYGVGARLDQQPELLFLLRNVDQEALISTELDITSATTGKGKRRLATADLSNLFDIDIEMDEPAKPRRKKQVAKKKTVVKTKTVKNKKGNKTVKKKAIKKSVKKAIKKKSAIKKKRVFTPTAAAVRRLRKQFEMNSSQFAVLVGVSPPTVSNWENGSGKLTLRQRTLEALAQVAGLTSQQAWRKLNRN